MSAATLVEAALAGSRRALGRLLTLVENEHPAMREALSLLYPHTGKAWIVGITGAPGTGKSSLVNALTKLLREQGATVAIVAVDPTSPFSGGAILGDRIRMTDLFADAGVFIRSMATRGSLGGLARATRDTVRVFDAAGYDYVIVETVGAGQNEVDIVRTAYTTLVIEAPGLGDDVQAIKAGILEIADILVVNKADRPGAIQTQRALKAMLELGHPAARDRFISHHGELLEVTPTAETHETSFWIPPVLQTITMDGTGIAEVAAAIKSHRQFAEQSGQIAQMQARAIEIELYERVQQALMQRFLQTVGKTGIAEAVEQINTRLLDPQTAVDRLLTQANVS